MQTDGQLRNQCIWWEIKRIRKQKEKDAPRLWFLETQIYSADSERTFQFENSEHIPYFTILERKKVRLGEERSQEKMRSWLPRSHRRGTVYVSRQKSELIQQQQMTTPHSRKPGPSQPGREQCSNVLFLIPQLGHFILFYFYNQN